MSSEDKCKLNRGHQVLIPAVCHRNWVLIPVVINGNQVFYPVEHYKNWVLTHVRSAQVLSAYHVFHQRYQDLMSVVRYRNQVLIPVALHMNWLIFPVFCNRNWLFLAVIHYILVRLLKVQILKWKDLFESINFESSWTISKVHIFIQTGHRNSSYIKSDWAFFDSWRCFSFVSGNFLSC